MNTQEKAATLVTYIKSLSDFQIIKVEEPYNHMGATITDAMLQSGLRYETVVRPRVNKLIQRYPEGKTTSGFLRLLNKIVPNVLLDWSDSKKPTYVFNVTRFFVELRIETETDLRTWLQDPANMTLLKTQQGIGDKTADYFKILVGLPTSAIDRHLSAFLIGAGIEASTYDEAQMVIHAVADLLRVNRSDLDHSIWKYMSTRGNDQSSTKFIDMDSVAPSRSVALMPTNAEVSVVAASPSTNIASIEGKGTLYYRFWQQLLEKARSRTNLHARTSPSKIQWIGATSRGFGYNYAIRSSDAYVELWISQSNADVNKQNFDRLYAQKQAIEKSFGDMLLWRRMDGNCACSIQYILPQGGFRDQHLWPRIQEQLIDAMVRLENAFRPYIS